MMGVLLKMKTLAVTRAYQCSTASFIIAPELVVCRKSYTTTPGLSRFQDLRGKGYKFEVVSSASEDYLRLAARCSSFSSDCVEHQPTSSDSTADRQLSCQYKPTARTASQQPNTFPLRRLDFRGFRARGTSGLGAK